MECIHRNGDITGYSVRYEVLNSMNPQTMNVGGGNSFEAIITDLEPTTFYSIEVAAVNSVGTGVYSAAISPITKGLLCR